MSDAIAGPDGRPVPAPANVVQVFAPQVDMLDPGSYNVNVAGMQEAITQPFYSYLAYPAAGSAQPLQFFQSQPTGTITAEDTNMTLAGQLAAGSSFLVQSIGIDYLPGTAAVRFGAQSALSHVADLFAILRRGVLQFSIGGKEYLRLAPLLQLPVRSHINAAIAASDQTTPAAAMQTFASIAFADGPVFSPRPLLIPAGQNFLVTLAWPAGAVAIPSADAAARIGIQLGGTLYRPVQ
jgi:hypothetical protein